MANSSTYRYSCDTAAVESNHDRQISSRNSLNSNAAHISHVISQRQLNNSSVPTTCFVLFENASSTNSNEIGFRVYQGTRARKHHSHKLFLAQLIRQNWPTSSDHTYHDFANSIRGVLPTIPIDELSSYVVSVRAGVLYFFSKCFRFHGGCCIEDLRDLTQKVIPTSDQRFYQSPVNNGHSLDESLRSSFCNVKPISDTKKFAEKLRQYKFLAKEQKHVFRIYLQSDDKQNHVCTVDPAMNYSVVEFSKDFQRTSNIGKLTVVVASQNCIRDRHSSKFYRENTYDDVFDFRIQFQHSPRTHRDQMTTIEYELRQEFPQLDNTFKNEHIFRPIDGNTADVLHMSQQLYPYVRFIRRDFGDVYHYDGDDHLFEGFIIYVENSVEYRNDRDDSTWKRQLATHGIVHARLNLNTLMSANTVDENLLIEKLWDMGIGLTDIAGECTTSLTQQSTNYYTRNGEQFNAEDEALVQRILQQPSLPLMLGLPKRASKHDIEQSYDHLVGQLDAKWHCIPRGPTAHGKLTAYYTSYLNEGNREMS